MPFCFQIKMAIYKFAYEAQKIVFQKAAAWGIKLRFSNDVDQK